MLLHVSNRTMVPAAFVGAVTALSIMVVAVGGVVRVLEAGLGCPDWPLCYGQVVPPGSGPAVIEFSHRVVAGLFSLSVLWLAVAAWRGRGGGSMASPQAQARMALARLAVWAAVLIGVQVVLGGLNVLTELSPEVGATHLAVAMVLVGLLAGATELAAAAHRGVPASGPGSAEARSRLRAGLVIAVLAVVVVVIGGYMRARGASLACTDWPLCRGRVLPELAWPVLLHWLHRVSALALGVALAVGAWRFRGRYGWALGLYVAQAALGALGVVWLLPPVVRVAHLTVAAMLVALVASEVARGFLEVRIRSQLPERLGA